MLIRWKSKDKSASSNQSACGSSSSSKKKRKGRDGGKYRKKNRYSGRTQYCLTRSGGQCCKGSNATLSFRRRLAE